MPKTDPTDTRRLLVQAIHQKLQRMTFAQLQETYTSALSILSGKR